MKIKSVAIFIVLVALLTPLFLDAFSAICKLNKETMELNSFNDSDGAQEEDTNEEKEFDEIIIYAENYQQSQEVLVALIGINAFSFAANFKNQYHPIGIDYPPEI